MCHQIQYQLPVAKAFAINIFYISICSTVRLQTNSKQIYDSSYTILVQYGCFESCHISDIRQIVGYRTPVFIQRFPWRLHITITYNLPHL
jgi:hypothetical protein